MQKRGEDKIVADKNDARDQRRALPQMDEKELQEVASLGSVSNALRTDFEQKPTRGDKLRESEPEWKVRSKPSLGQHGTLSFEMVCEAETATDKATCACVRICKCMCVMHVCAHDGFART